MSTKEQVAKWKEQAEARLAEKQKGKAEQGKRDELNALLRSEKVAAEREEADKVRARRIFLAEGGSQAVFEKNWPKMYETLVFERTLQKMAKPGGVGVELVF